MATLNCHSIIDPKYLDWNEAQQEWRKGKILEEYINGERVKIACPLCFQKKSGLPDSFHKTIT